MASSTVNVDQLNGVQLMIVQSALQKQRKCATAGKSLLASPAFLSTPATICTARHWMGIHQQIEHARAMAEATFVCG